MHTLENISVYPAEEISSNKHKSYDHRFFSHFEHRLERNPLAVELLSHHLSNQILLDLGAGNTGDAHHYFSKFGVKGYIGVEPFNYGRLEDELSYNVTHFNSSNYKVWKTHLLHALENIPDDSVSILTSGLEPGLIYDRDYISSANDLIARKLHPNGILMSNSSRFFVPSSFEQIISFDDYSNRKDGIHKKIKFV